jgi:hypothetical protein
MYECAKSKDVDYCFRCDEYPCKMIKPLISRYKSVHKVLLLENGNYIRDNGIQAFMKGEKERYSCKKCDGIVDQHYGKCSECEK